MAAAQSAVVYRKKDAWKRSWDKVQSGQSLWKSVEFGKYPACSYELLTQHSAPMQVNAKNPASVRIYIPLGGDCAFILHAYNKGHTVVVSEWCDAPIANLKTKVPGQWNVQKLKRESPGVAGGAGAQTEDVLVHTSPDKRLIVWQCSYLVALDKEEMFDIVYDKDAFGAVSIVERAAYAEKCVQHVKEGGHVLLEVKDRSEEFPETKDAGTSEQAGGVDPQLFTVGPPFHITQQICLDHYKGCELKLHTPAFYPMPNSPWKQDALLLQKK